LLFVRDPSGEQRFLFLLPCFFSLGELLTFGPIGLVVILSPLEAVTRTVDYRFEWRHRTLVSRFVGRERWRLCFFAPLYITCRFFFKLPNLASSLPSRWPFSRRPFCTHRPGRSLSAFCSNIFCTCPPFSFFPRLIPALFPATHPPKSFPLVSFLPPVFLNTTQPSCLLFWHSLRSRDTAQLFFSFLGQRICHNHLFPILFLISYSFPPPTLFHPPPLPV